MLVRRGAVERRGWLTGPCAPGRTRGIRLVGREPVEPAELADESPGAFVARMRRLAADVSAPHPVPHSACWLFGLAPADGSRPRLCWPAMASLLLPNRIHPSTGEYGRERLSFATSEREIRADNEALDKKYSGFVALFIRLPR